jgi:hypothetical protein
MTNPDRLSNYNAAQAHMRLADNPHDEKWTTDGDMTGEVGYELAAAQVRALLAVADELKALREAVADAISGLDGEHSNLRWINNWLKDLVENR